MVAENEMLIKEIVVAIRRLVHAVYLDTSKMSRQYGLTGSQSGVLRSLFQEGPLSSASLSRRLHVTPSNITGIIDRLEKKGLVERTPKQGDRRIALIKLTDSGTGLSKLLPDPIETKLISGLVDMERKEIEELNLSMNQILNLIDAKYISDTPLDWHHSAGSILEDNK